MKVNFKTKRADIVNLFREHCIYGCDVKEGEQQLKALRGNPDCRTLMIAPPCTLDEYAQGVPFCNQAAQTFHYWAQENCGIDTERDFLICAASMYGEKPGKHSTDLVVNFVKAAVEQQLIDKIVCVGEPAFKFVFAEGKKPNMTTLIGGTVYMPIVQHRPIFVLPDIAMLAPNFEGADKKERWILQRLQQECARRLDALSQKFKKFVKE